MDIYALGIGFIAGVGFMMVISPINGDSRSASKIKPKITKCDCDGCNMEHGYQPCHKKPLEPPNTKLNGDPLD